MSISLRERFLDICHFKRPGDLWLRDHISEQTLKNWVEQGAPKEIMNPRFHGDYFQYQYRYFLWEIRSGLFAPAWARDRESPTIDLGHGLTFDEIGYLLVPAYEVRFISEDERTVTHTTGRGQTLKSLKESLKTGWGMSMYVDFAVKDRASWNEHKKRLDPNTPERWPSDWNAYVQEMNGISEPLVLDVGGFFWLLTRMGRDRKSILHVL